MPTVLITPEVMREKPAPYVDILKEAGFDIRYPVDPLLHRGLGTEEATIRELEGIDAIIAGGDRLTARVIANSPQLRVIARCGVGFDRVDIPTATAHHIPVTITPTANHECVAEHTLALLLAVTRGIVKYDKMLRSGVWMQVLTSPIRTKIFGIVGLGRIGRSTAIRARALGMKVLAADEFPDLAFIEQQGIQLVDLATLLAESDFVSVHCPLSTATAELFNATTFAMMKPGAIFLNTARGGLVNEPDLIAALQSGHLGGAGLDVFSPEPPAADNPLFKMDNVVLSPHIAGTDSLSMENMGIESAQNIVTLHRGEWPVGAVVNNILREGWRWERESSR